MKIPDSAHDVLSSDALAHLTTIDADGRPHVTCAWVGLEGDEVVIATLFEQRKLANMRRDPRVSVSLEGRRTNDMGLKEYLVISGHAQVTEGGAPGLLQRLARTYLGPDVAFPPMPNPPAGFVTRITAERISGVGPWASAP